MIDALQLGEVELYRVVESHAALLAPGELFPDWRNDLAEINGQWLTPRFYDRKADRLVIAIQSFLLKTRQHTILVDACAGNDKPRQREFFNHRHWPWLDALKATGTTTADVDIVLCSHLHVDHVGWNTRLDNGRWVPTFPKARYLFSRNDWAYWQARSQADGLARTGDYFADSVLPIFEAGQAELVDGDFAIEDDIVLQPTPGHSPGHVAVQIRNGTALTILSGDIMHHPLQCRNPDWSTNFCVDPALSRRTRRSFLETHAAGDTLIVPAHFPAPTAGRLFSAEQGFGFRFYGE
jgi:glyoxylase-like metal-dependent hydrolase (beta-lactamase superfamily II)